MPFAFDSSQGTKVFVEIAQTGSGAYKDAVKLDAPEAWAKYYIDADRIDTAVLGIFNGGYGGDTDVLGRKSGEYGKYFDGTNAVRYDYYFAEDTAFQGIPDERPCKKPGSEENSPSLTRYSSQMPPNGWYKDITTKELYDKYRCNDKRWKPTEKSGKYVIFVKASWANAQPQDASGRLGRVNAFKVGAAYADAKLEDVFDNPITGYWSNPAAATRSSEPTTASYAIQDRLSESGTFGDYEFNFAADCRLAVGSSEERFLHWKDIDFPDYYEGTGAVPEFTLIDIDQNGNEVERTTIKGSQQLNGRWAFNGPGAENQHNYLKFIGKGGHKYRWIWKNIIRKDGIGLWLPYDDYGYYRGCGQWDHDFTMRAGAEGQLGTKEFRIAGGQTATINLVQTAKGKEAGPETDIDLTVAAANSPASGNKSIATTFEGISASLGGSSSCDKTASPSNPDCKSTPFSRVVGWDNLGRLGPAPTYTSSRNDIYARFKVREDAPDGARYCASAIMSPKSNTNPGGLQSAPQQICFTVDNSLKPYLTTTGGDVHAGNDCIISTANPRTPQTIIGQGVAGSARGSSGSYIVSAGDAITKFGSGGAPDSTNLSFGKTGYYGSICRPALEDLQKELAKGGFTSIPGNTATPFNLASLAAGQRYLVYFNGDGTVFGKSSAPVTVYSSGTLTIQGAEFGSNLATVASRTNLPVVGVIAKDIDIKREVTGITAQLYATGNIDTCSDSTASACRSVLLLRGFAMAHDFSFKRSGTGANGLQLAELFGFGAAFYLNPPPGFGTAAGAVKYLGERAPLY